jgi:hypothetical protein
VHLLNRIQRTKGGELWDWHRFRITSPGAANLLLGSGEATVERSVKPFLGPRVQTTLELKGPLKDMQKS